MCLLPCFRYAQVASIPILLVVAGISRGDDFQPDQSKLPTPPPENAIILFDGDGICRFVNMEGDEHNWPIEDGAITSTRKDGKRSVNHICSTVHFRDADIHAEFMLPENGSGNSGVYIHGNYELQVIRTDPDKKKLDKGDAGAIYGFHPPLVNAAKGPGEWQVYDIRYTAPRRDESGKIVKEGSVTTWLNGKKTQDNAAFGEPRSTYHPFRYHTTDYLRKIYVRQNRTGVGPVFLQDHDNATKFRNVWIVPRDDLAGPYEAE